MNDEQLAIFFPILYVISFIAAIITAWVVYTKTRNLPKGEGERLLRQQQGYSSNLRFFHLKLPFILALGLFIVPLIVLAIYGLTAFLKTLAVMSAISYSLFIYLASRKLRTTNDPNEKKMWEQTLVSHGSLLRMGALAMVLILVFFAILALFVYLLLP